jgi:hypothetical protein
MRDNERRQCRSRDRAGAAPGEVSRGFNLEGISSASPDPSVLSDPLFYAAEEVKSDRRIVNLRRAPVLIHGAASASSDTSPEA